jgi:hypothetical protein
MDGLEAGGEGITNRYAGFEFYNQTAIKEG